MSDGEMWDDSLSVIHLMVLADVAYQYCAMIKYEHRIAHLTLEQQVTGKLSVWKLSEMIVVDMRKKEGLCLPLFNQSGNGPNVSFRTITACSITPNTAEGSWLSSR